VKIEKSLRTLKSGAKYAVYAVATLSPIKNELLNILFIFYLKVYTSSGVSIRN